MPLNFRLFVFVLLKCTVETDNICHVADIICHPSNVVTININCICVPDDGNMNQMESRSRIYDVIKQNQSEVGNIDFEI